MKLETSNNRSMKYSKGPWTFRLQVLSDGVNSNLDYINPRTIENYYEIRGGCGYFQFEEEAKGFNLTGYMKEPDARLIAAAPDLLNALEQMMISLNKSSCGWNMDSDIERAYSLCKEAYLKSTGP